MQPTQDKSMQTTASQPSITDAAKYFTSRSNVPFNISILSTTPDVLKGLKPVKVLDIFESTSSSNFHEDGLFSVSIFGRVGDERRDMRFSYIDIKVEIFHPVIYNILVKLKRLYEEIMQGHSYAIFDPVEKDFIRVSAIQEGADTGYEFFVKHWKQIEFKQTGSTNREQGIALVRKFADQAMTSKIVVMPAGLRDLEFDENNRIKEDEINSDYRRLIALSNTINDIAMKTNPEILDSPRYELQKAFNAIYDRISDLIEGKKKLLLGKWASRRVFNGTRNVITAMDPAVPYLGAEHTPGFNSTIVGLYQYLKATLPVSIFQVQQFLSSVFPSVDQPARLINKKTLKSEEVLLASRYYSRWATNDGIEAVITAYKEESIRNLPLEIDGHYVLLIYKGPDGTFKIMHSIDELPPTRNPEHVHPITLTELLYLSVHKNANNYPMLVTRYPVTGIGSIYVSMTYLRPTLKTEIRRRLDERWQPTEDAETAYEFPLQDSAFVNSLIPHSANLAGLNADFDGDTSSCNIAYFDESIEEAKKFLSSRRAYVGTDGEFIKSTGVATVEYVLRNMTS